ncbi:MAG: PilZ domain-containing protein [Myxococcota bacterium]
MTTNQELRWEDRRESLRVPVEMLVRSYDQDTFEVCTGDISLGGARINFRRPPRDPQVEVLLQLGGPWGEVRLQGDIIGFRAVGNVYEARVCFVDWDTMDELALARMIHEVSQGWETWTADAALV